MRAARSCTGEASWKSERSRDLRFAKRHGSSLRLGWRRVVKVSQAFCWSCWNHWGQRDEGDASGRGASPVTPVDPPGGISWMLTVEVAL